MDIIQIMTAKQIFKAFQEKITYLICPDNPTFHKYINVQRTEVYQSLKENLTNITFWGRKETLFTATSIIDKSFQFDNDRELIEEQFSQLVEDKSAYVSQGKRKIGRNKYSSLRKTYNVLSSGGIISKTIIYFALIQSKLSC